MAQSGQAASEAVCPIRQMKVDEWVAPYLSAKLGLGSRLFDYLYPVEMGENLPPYL